jgi:hypothetical protein
VIMEGSPREQCRLLASRLLLDYHLSPASDTDELAETIAEAARRWMSKRGFNHGQLGVGREDVQRDG